MILSWINKLDKKVIFRVSFWCYENMGIFLENPLISCPINMSPEIFLQHLCHFSVGIFNHMVASCVLRPEGSVIMPKSLQLGGTQRSLYLENIQNLSTHACKQGVTYWKSFFTTGCFLFEINAAIPVRFLSLFHLIPIV